MSTPKHVLKAEGEGNTDLFIERIKDGKRVADVSGTDINPTAPVYYKIMSELEAIVTAGLLDGAPDDDALAAVVAPATTTELAPTDDPRLKERQEAEAIVVKLRKQAESKEAPATTTEQVPMEEAVKVRYAKDSPMPPINPTFGDRTPDFVSWLTATNPKEAAKRYAGKNVPAYEAAK